MPAPTFEAPALNLLVLRTANVDRLRAFYALLGLAFRQEQHGGGPVHYSARCGGSTTLELYPATPTAGADASTRLGFAVGDVAAACDVLRDAGHAIRAEPKASEWGVRAVAVDPDGRAVELLQRGEP